MPVRPDVASLLELAESSRQAEARLALALRAGGMAAWEWTGVRDVWTPDLYALLGLTGDEPPSTELFFRCVHPEDRDALAEDWARAVQGEAPYDTAFRIRRPDGQIRWLRGVGQLVRDDTGQVARIYGLNWDVTEERERERDHRRRHDAERFLVDTTELFSSSLDRAQIVELLTQACVPAIADLAIADVYGPDGAVARLAIHGADPARDTQVVALGAHPADYLRLCGGERGAREGVLLQGSALEGALFDRLPSAHAQALRALAPEALVAVPLREGPRPRGTLTLLSTDRRRPFDRDDLHLAEELARRVSLSLENAELYARATRASEAKSEFLTTLSHEIRTPLTAVLGYADLLQADERDPRKLDSLRRIERNGQLLLSLLNDVLDLSKIEAGQLTLERAPVELAELLEDVRSMMVGTRAKDLDFDVVVESPVPLRLHTDAKRVRQILGNLVGNAVKFTERGAVTVRVRYSEADRQLAFDVIDTGLGMSEQEQIGLFRPFVQGESAKRTEAKGTGLGLAISRSLAEQLGGSLRVRSALGQGSTFTLRVDVGELDEQPLGEPAAPARRQRPRSGEHLLARVLVVDDHDDVRGYVARVLDDSGVDVRAAASGEAALAEVEADGDALDAILLDLHMPGLDGLEAAERIRALGFTGPLLAFTADAREASEARCFEAGFNGVLRKPIHADALLAAVREALATPERGAPGPEPRPVEGAGSRGCVLVVDDSEDAATLVRAQLERAGYAVFVAHCGADALRAAASHRPDAVLLDLGLPDMSGLALLARLREAHAGTRLLALTGEASRDPGLRARFDDYLVKPASRASLLAALERSLERP